MEEFMAAKKKNGSKEAREDRDAISSSQKPAAAIVGRHGKVAVLVNGDAFDSVRKAFADLKLPLKEKSRVRRALRETGKALVKYNEVEYNFVRMGNGKEEEAEE
jgi:hypothetical protein